MLYSGFNILPRSVFWSADLNGRSDNTDVMWLNNENETVSNFDPADVLGFNLLRNWYSLLAETGPERSGPSVERTALR